MVPEPQQQDAGRPSARPTRATRAHSLSREMTAHEAMHEYTERNTHTATPDGEHSLG